jgi:hypothetical protein
MIGIEPFYVALRPEVCAIHYLPVMVPHFVEGYGSVVTYDHQLRAAYPFVEESGEVDTLSQYRSTV